MKIKIQENNWKNLKVRKLANILIIFFASCSSSREPKANESTVDTTNYIFEGGLIFSQNCSGCHSYNTDTTFSRLTLFDLYEKDNSDLFNSLNAILKDSIHKNKIIMEDSLDVKSVLYYIKQSYLNKR